MISKRAISLFALALLLLAAMVPSASAASINLAKQEGPNVDLWITSADAVNSAEICMLVNYGDQDVILKVTGNQPIEGNKTYLTQVVEAHDSQIIELPFPDVDTRYWLTIIRGGETVLELSKSRPNYLVMPPSTTWTITKTTPQDNAKYTEWDLAAALANLTIEIIVVATVVAAFGAMIGAGVKQLTKFLVPTDFLTMSFFAFLFLDGSGLVQVLSGFDKLWYLPLGVGYIIGFLLWHIDYILPVRTDCKEKTIDVRPVAVYMPDNDMGWCIQTQRNRELLKRFMGVHHRLGSDSGLVQDWIGYFKKPYLPKIRGRILWVQKSEVTAEETSIWRFRCKRYTTTFKLAHASGVEKAQWLQDAKWYFKLQDMYDRLALKYGELMLAHRQESTKMGSAMVEHSTKINPAQRISKFWNKNETPVDLETGENTMTTIEQEATAIQDGVAKRSAEEDEEISYDKAAKASEADDEPKARVKRKNESDEEE